MLLGPAVQLPSRHSPLAQSAASSQPPPLGTSLAEPSPDPEPTSFEPPSELPHAAPPARLAKSANAHSVECRKYRMMLNLSCYGRAATELTHFTNTSVSQPTVNARRPPGADTRSQLAPQSVTELGASGSS